VYSYHLLFAPEEIIAYVAVHELCHVRHKNHSAAFWAEVAKYCPDYKSKRKWLQAHSVFMQIF
jgi:predicted metal-dependent hydrolase